MLIFTNKYVLGLKKRIFPYLLLLLAMVSCAGQGGGGTDGACEVEWKFATPDGLPARVVAVDTMELANPFVRYERKSNIYYMIGDGGYMWTSSDLRTWTGPYNVLRVSDDSWYGKDSEILAPEIHAHNGRYCYMASLQDKTSGHISCAVFTADEITGPYIPVAGEDMLLDSLEVAGHPTFCTDEMDAGYMIYSDSNEPGGVLRIIRFTKDMEKRMGESYVMFSGADNALDVAKDGRPIEAPYLFVTDTGAAGLLFTAYDGEESVVAVAYTTNELGHWLNGPWVAEPQPLVKGNAGGASLFTDYDGTLVMAFHKDTLINGKNIKVPRFMKMDRQFEKLEKIGYYNF